jgi:hypothetical protein
MDHGADSHCGLNIPFDLTGKSIQRVGWVEQNDTHRLELALVMGFAKGLNPSYKTTLTDLRAERNSSNGINVQSPLKKYPDSIPTQITSITFAVSSHRRGDRDRHGRGAGCGGRELRS